MKYFITVCLTVMSTWCLSQQLTYQQWKSLAKTEIRMLPEYGNITKTPGQKEADKTLIETEIKQYGTARKAAEQAITFGFNNFYAGDLKTAMYRFNQAWLLDPQDENVYWGYSIIYFSFQDYDEALRQIQKGLLINPKSSNILTDKATIYTQFYHLKNDPAFLDKAIELFNQSYKIDSQNQNTLFKLSVAYFYKQDCTNALRFYNECMKLGGKQITPGYGDALKKQCNR